MAVVQERTVAGPDLLDDFQAGVVAVRMDGDQAAARSEGFGNVLVEALGCGTPVISTDCPHGPGDILARGRYGILVPARDPEALAPAFGQLLDERDRWPAAMLRARASAFSYGACADEYASLFRSLV